MVQAAPGARIAKNRSHLLTRRLHPSYILTSLASPWDELLQYLSSFTVFRARPFQVEFPAQRITLDYRFNDTLLGAMVEGAGPFSVLALFALKALLHATILLGCLLVLFVCGAGTFMNRKFRGCHNAAYVHDVVEGEWEAKLRVSAFAAMPAPQTSAQFGRAANCGHGLHLCHQHCARNQPGAVPAIHRHGQAEIRSGHLRCVVRADAALAGGWDGCIVPGVSVAIGHCQPTADQLREAVAHGVDYVIHLGNGATGAVLPLARRRRCSRATQASLGRSSTTAACWRSRCATTTCT